MKELRKTTTGVVCMMLIAGVAYAGCGGCGPAKATSVAACGLKAEDCTKAKAAGADCAKCVAKTKASHACCAKAEAAGVKCSKCAPAPAKPAVLTTGALKVLLAAGTPVTVLDARSGKGDDGVRIPGAQQLSPGAPKEKVAAVLKSKDQLVVTYCASVKCGASRKLAGHLTSLGYRNVLEYSEGIAGWVKAGNKTVKEGS